MTSSSQKFREHLGLDDAERTVPTASMWPTIRAGDGIRFRRERRTPKLGEVWVVEMGQLHVCHRVIWVSGEHAWLKGDWVLAPDGRVPVRQLFGPLSAVRRDGDWRPTNRRRDRAMGLALSLVGSTWQVTRSILGSARRLAFAR